MFDNYALAAEFLASRVKDCQVLVVGDVMLDRYYFGEVKRISPEAPVPVTRVLSEKEVLGGAANVVRNLALLGCRVLLAGMTGQDNNRNRMTKLLADIGVEADGLITGNRPTTTKLRVIGGHQQMLRLDFEDTRPVSPSAVKKLCQYVEQSIQAGVAAIIISDYGKGLCTPALCQCVIQAANRHKIPIIVDPKGDNWLKYSEAYLLTPNLKEISEAVRRPVTNSDKAVKLAADKVRRRFKLSGVVVTRSEKGLTLIDDAREVHIPTRAQEVFDVSGAGDTVIAVLGAALAGGLDLADAAQLANLAAGVVVAKLGTYAISREELVEAFESFVKRE
ncbi:MAG TPA: D-glycero-beta-D-manno-heptose-7-phosphate kinase [Methylomusa anaerophila]|uniref:Bifunctional protein HldE n=1 Tax=Methylomusa anaerophila TaxID=1930071 RepID=A0A348AKK8_9FIRM|nr:D-glycero-beta-D-manno-heptose-7-phosphate kinase [Methylomusa anaerophila]BBB91606.1 bifunctional protein HldE [Methylomusa anaerophila]HML89456.1 D-glycero-beta-D-manno-heptose-7-phosphate kinase [Methylomusa anaerophila]